MLDWKNKRNKKGEKYWELSDTESNTAPYLHLFCDEKNDNFFFAKAIVSADSKPVYHSIGNIPFKKAKDVAAGWLFNLYVDEYNE